MKKYVGIDVGLLGAIVSIDSQGVVVKYKMPLIGKVIDVRKLKDILELEQGTVIIENIGIILGSSKKAAFSMGYQSGLLEAMCVALNLPYTKVHAKLWQKEMFQGIPEIKKGTKRDTKAMALVSCQRLYPNMDLTFTERAQKPHDGLVDALLIAEYAKRRSL